MVLMRLSKIALSEHKQGVRNVLRLGFGFLGVAALALSFQVVRSFNEEVHWHLHYWPMYRPKFWAAVGSYGFLSLVLVFLGAIAYVCLCYAFAKRKGMHYAKSAVWASGAVLLESLLSQLLLVLIVGSIIILRLPPELRADAHLGWSKELWSSTRSSPVFIVLAIITFALVFRWKYRQPSRS